DPFEDGAPPFDYGDEPAARGLILEGRAEIEVALDYFQGPAPGEVLSETLDEVARFLVSEQTADVSAPESLSLDEMRARFVHVARGPLIVDMGNTYRRLRPAEFAAAYAHNKVTIGQKAVPVTALWAQSAERMAVDCLAFHPGAEQFFIERGLRHLNLWSPPQWPAVDTAAAEPFTEHLEYLIPGAREREDLLDWLAHAAQRPAVRPHFHFLLVAAQEGTGRSWLAEILRRVWGERHAGEIDLHHLLDDPFNSMLSGKILMAVHEVKAPAEERYSHRDRLKSLLTDTQITINEKHEPRWAERFCARFLMFTNRDDALPLSETDRRVYVVRCVDAPRSADYYSHLYRQKESPELLAAVWQLLRSRDLAGFNPGQRAPLNEMKQQMIASGRTDEQQLAVDFAKACPYQVVASNDLMTTLAPPLEHERPPERKARTNAITAALREIGAQTHAKKVRIDRYPDRVWIFREPLKWSVATPALLKAEADRAHLDITAGRCHAESIMARWEGDAS
ncbi:MAG TPA: DUF5906 domain-containing protein, partial [Burkholderiales bacterium]|nr:DUF5906 domain-containing protein [Burkholderiales bacterium]